MVNKFIVECPHCKMRFFVTDDLLNAANGNLRCGFCLHIFNGSHSIVYEAMGNSVAANSSTMAQQPNKQSNLTNNSTQQPATESYSEEYWREVVSTFSSFSINTDNLDKQQTDSKDNNATPTEQLTLADNSGDGKDFFDRSIIIDKDIATYLDKMDFDGLLQLDEQELIDSHNKKVTDFIQNSVVEDSVDTTNPAQTELTLTSPEKVDDLLEPSAKDVKIDDDIPILEDDNVVRDMYGNKLKVVTAIDFEHTTTQPKLVNKMNLLWSSLSILAVLLLIAQYLHYAVPKMAHTTANRAWAEQVCQYVFCQLPVQIDVNKITTDKLVVRSDPNQQGVLLVDSIIYNNADFPQPYPIIELRFTNLNGQLVASRRFLPEEYLNNETLGKNQMPASMPVYISFQIVDPGEEATGYSLHYYPAPTVASQHL